MGWKFIKGKHTPTSFPKTRSGADSRMATADYTKDF